MKNDIEPSQKTSNTTYAIVTIVIGATMSIALPWLLTQTQFFSGISFLETGQIGDTIGGIAGPVLNFAGLLVVYFSLQEQLKANQDQVRNFNAEQHRSNNESVVSTSFKIIDDLRAEIRQAEEDKVLANYRGLSERVIAFTQPEFKGQWIYDRNNNVKMRYKPRVYLEDIFAEDLHLASTKDQVKEYFNLLEDKLNGVVAIFEMLKYLIEGSNLPERQKVLLYNIVYSFYEPYIVKRLQGLEIFSDSSLFAYVLIDGVLFLDSKIKQGADAMSAGIRNESFSVSSSL